MRGRLPLAISLFVYFALTVALMVCVPLGAAPDEAAHWQYVEHIAKLRQLPVFRGEVPPAPGYEFHQPPLYYAICAPAWALFEGRAPALQNFACRTVNIGFGMLTLILIWATGRTLFPSRREVAVLAIGYAALWPLHQAVGVASGNDALAGLICAALFYLIARGIMLGWHRGELTLTGLGIAAGIYTKNTCLVVAVAALGAVFEGVLRAHRDTVRAVLASAGTAVLSIVLSAFLLIRNTIHYGDPFGWTVFNKAATAGTPGFPAFSQVLGTALPDYARGVMLVTVVNAWGIFGGPDSASKEIKPLDARLPSWTMGPLLVVLASAVVTGLGLYRAWVHYNSKSVVLDEEKSGESVRDVEAVYTSPTSDLTPEEFHEYVQKVNTVWRWWALGVALVVLAWMKFSYEHMSGAQARYLHPALLPVCVGAAAGWTEFWGRNRQGIIAAIVVGLVLLGLSLGNIFGWQTLV